MSTPDSTPTFMKGRASYHRFLVAACFGFSAICAISAKADDPQDYLIQKVCVDDKGNVLPVDPDNPPAGSHLRNLRVGEPLPYNKYDQPLPGHSYGVQRHDSYPVLDKDGNVLALNPFYFSNNNSDNGYDLYCMHDGWASAPSTRDGGGFSTTFFGEDNGALSIYNGWLFFPASFVTGGYKPESGSTRMPIVGRYWEHDGEPWPGKQKPNFFVNPASETSWQLIKNCPFGGIDGNPVKQIDTILVVHGYVSKDKPQYVGNMTKGHLEIYYFTQLYGTTRWEVWWPIGQMNDYNKPSDLRTNAIRTANVCAKPIPGAGEWYVQPTDLPQTPENRFIATMFTGEDGDKNMYFVSDVRDWSCVNVLPSPQLPPPCPLPQQNLLANFHFDEGAFAPWQSSGDGANPIKWSLMQSQATRDVIYTQTAPKGGVRYLSLNSPDAPKSGQRIYQDIPVKNLKNGAYGVSMNLRSENGQGTMRMLLQQVDAKGAILSTDMDVTNTVGPRNPVQKGYSYNGPHDAAPYASVVMSSTMIAGRAQVTIRPDAASLRFSIQPQTSGAFDILDANVSNLSDWRATGSEALSAPATATSRE